MADIKPFDISVPSSQIAALKRKLEEANFPDELDDSGWDYGTPLADVKRLTEHWKDKFDWKKREADLNRLPNFQTTVQVDGFEPLAIHFLHERSNVKGAIPLLFCHGWPGNFLEVTKIMPMLVQGGKDYPAFHVVAPSIPGYGFSEGTKRKGFGLKQYAQTLHQLMMALGYDVYVTQGGDWGCMITRIMGLMFPDHIRASHINMVRGHKPTLLSNPILYLQHALAPYSKREKDGLARSRWFTTEGAGYREQQKTKPQTLGYGLADSPVALLAWILEKLHDWTHDYPWTDDEILTWVSIYWFSTAGPTASLRIYYESVHVTGDYHRSRTELYIPTVKLGLSFFPKELTVVPRSFGRTMGPVVFEGVHEHGGHFAAHEHPEAIVGDLRKMFGKDGGAYGIVDGKNGYE